MNNEKVEELRKKLLPDMLTNIKRDYSEGKEIMEISKYYDVNLNDLRRMIKDNNMDIITRCKNREKMLNTYLKNPHKNEHAIVEDYRNGMKLNYLLDKYDIDMTKYFMIMELYNCDKPKFFRSNFIDSGII